MTRIADFVGLAAALVAFSKTLKKLADARPERHPLRAVLNEFDCAVPELRDFRNSLNHAEDWLAGDGHGGQSLVEVTGLVGNDDVSMVLTLADKHGEHRLVPLSVHQVEHALAAAMEAIHGHRTPVAPSSE